MLAILRKISVATISLLIPAAGWSQTIDSSSVFNEPIAMDTVVIRSGFEVNSFIKRVKKDTTFYKAFRSMHLFPYDAYNQIYALGGRGDTLASLESTVRQIITGKCRSHIIRSRKVTGNYLTKKGENNYYTGELFDYLFLTKTEVCNEDDIVAGKMEYAGKGKIEAHKHRLKQLIFNPGAKISGIPFMADHENIFDESESYKYNFKVTMDVYNGESCYVFAIVPRKGFENKTLYNQLVTWFRKSDYSIVAREYSLSYHTLLYDFDVRMKVKTLPVKGKNCPSYISYDGNWHIFTKKRERVSFTTKIEYNDQ